MPATAVMAVRPLMSSACWYLVEKNEAAMSDAPTGCAVPDSALKFLQGCLLLNNSPLQRLLVGTQVEGVESEVAWQAARA